MTKSIYIYNTCIYTYMHVCICTRMDVFLLECNVKSRLVALCPQRLLVRRAGPGGGPQSERTISPSSHHNATVIYIFSGYIQEEAGSPPPPLASNHHHHHPRIGLLKSLASFPCVSKADWLRKSGRGGTSSGFGILHWLVFLQSLLLCWIY